MVKNHLDIEKRQVKDETTTRLPITSTHFRQERFGHHKATRLARGRKK